MYHIAHLLAFERLDAVAHPGAGRPGAMAARAGIVGPGRQERPARQAEQGKTQPEDHRPELGEEAPTPTIRDEMR